MIVFLTSSATASMNSAVLRYELLGTLLVLSFEMAKSLVILPAVIKLITECSIASPKFLKSSLLSN